MDIPKSSVDTFVEDALKDSDFRSFLSESRGIKLHDGDAHSGGIQQVHLTGGGLHWYATKYDGTPRQNGTSTAAEINFYGGVHLREESVRQSVLDFLENKGNSLDNYPILKALYEN